MNSEAIAAVSISVVGITQLLKWSGVNDKLGPIVVLLLSAIGVAFWGWAQQDLQRSTAFEYFAGWVIVATSAAGVYGFTRAGSAGITRMTAPPDTGAGSEPTIKG